MNKKLRLVVTEDCPRNCAGCCMKQWTEKIEDFNGHFDLYSEIIDEILQEEKING